MAINREDYAEPVCPFCTDFYDNKKSNINSIPLLRVTQKLDEYLAKNDYDNAERHLLYWYVEAENGNDLRGKLSVSNELMGLYRKLGRKDDAYKYAVIAEELIGLLKLENTVTSATSYVNIATVYKAFGEPDKGYPYYEKAKIIYESELKSDDDRIGALYNNMGLCLCDLKDYNGAISLFEKAVNIMKNADEGFAEVAITYLNIANAYEAMLGLEDGDEIIRKFLDKAEKLLMIENYPKNGHYAYACEKCASVFSYYGYFLVDNELKKRSKEIYERS